MAPSFGLPTNVRDALYADAVKLARHVGYRNAGTVEFMVDKKGRQVVAACYTLCISPSQEVKRGCGQQGNILNLEG